MEPWHLRTNRSSVVQPSLLLRKPSTITLTSQQLLPMIKQGTTHSKERQLAPNKDKRKPLHMTKHQLHQLNKVTTKSSHSKHIPMPPSPPSLLWWLLATLGPHENPLPWSGSIAGWVETLWNRVMICAVIHLISSASLASCCQSMSKQYRADKRQEPF